MVAAPGTADAVAFWAEPRSSESYAKYWAASAQPHRQSLVHALHLLPKRFTSLLEVGCFVGTNLRLIHQSFPWAALTGIDINEGALAYGRERLPAVTFQTGDALTASASWPAPSVDLIVSCYALAYVAPTELCS